VKWQCTDKFLKGTLPGITQMCGGVFEYSIQQFYNIREVSSPGGQ